MHTFHKNMNVNREDIQYMHNSDIKLHHHTYMTWCQREGVMCVCVGGGGYQEPGWLLMRVGNAPGHSKVH